MPRLSIIIPNAADRGQLETTLLSVLENRPDGTEVIVVLTAPYDDPYELASEVRFVRAEPRSGLAECVNRGFHASRGRFVHLLACGAVVTPGWADRALEHFKNVEVAAVAATIVTADDQPLVANAGWVYRASGVAVANQQGRAYTEVPAGGIVDAPAGVAAFYRATTLAALEEVFCAAVGDELADVDLGLRIQGLGCCTVVEPAALVHVKPGQIGLRASGLLSGLQAERLFCRHFGFHSPLKSIVAHTGQLLVELVSGCLSLPRAAHLLGRSLVTYELPAILQHRRERAQLKSAATPATLPAGVRFDGEHEHAARLAPTQRASARRLVS